MTVSRNNLTGIECIPKSSFDQFFGRLDVFAVFFLELESPVENFLIGKTMQRSGKAVETSGVCVVGIRESRVGSSQPANRRLFRRKRNHERQLQLFPRDLGELRRHNIKGDATNQSSWFQRQFLVRCGARQDIGRRLRREPVSHHPRTVDSLLRT